MFSPILLSVALLAAVPRVDACPRKFHVARCPQDLVEKARVAARETHETSHTLPPLVTGGRQPKRFLRKFLRRCRKALNEPTADLDLCFHAQVVAIEEDAAWHLYRTHLPKCPVNHADAMASERRRVTQNWMTNDGHVEVEIRWKRLGDDGFFVRRDHPGAAHAIRGKVVKHQVWHGPHLSQLGPRKRSKWGVQCMYGSDGALLHEGAAAGTADRAHVRKHMRVDVYWFHAGLRLDVGDFNGRHVRDYQALHPVE